jgi:hypothetical protein
MAQTMAHNYHGQKWIRNERRCAIYARDDFRCVYCLEQTRLVLDHVEPFAGNDSENLVSSCADCNCDKGDKSLEAWLTQREARGEDRQDLRSIRQRVALATFLPPDVRLGRALEKRRPRGTFLSLPEIYETVERERISA